MPCRYSRARTPPLDGLEHAYLYPRPNEVLFGGGLDFLGVVRPELLPVGLASRGGLAGRSPGSTSAFITPASLQLI